LAAGTEIKRLRHVARRFGLTASIDPVLEALAKGDCQLAIMHLAQIDALLVARGDAGREEQIMLSVRGGILVLSEVLTRHANYFGAKAPR